VSFAIRRLGLALAIAAVSALSLASTAHAEFNFLSGHEGFDATYLNADGSPDAQAGSHPYSISTSLFFTTTENEFGEIVPDGDLRDTHVSLPPGFLGSATAMPACSAAQFASNTSGNGDDCPPSTQVGVADADIVGANGAVGHFFYPLYNLAPPPGVPAYFAFVTAGGPVVFTVSVHQAPGGEYALRADVLNNTQVLGVLGAKVTFWGVPAASVHDSQRGECLTLTGTGNGTCPTSVTPKALLTMPTSCSGPLSIFASADSWEASGAYLPNGEPDLADPNWKTASSLSHDNNEPPNPLGLAGCDRPPFTPTIRARPTTDAATSPTGLDFDLNFDDPGLESPNPGALAQSQLKKAVVTLPQGFTANPSLAEGLHACTEAQYESETVSPTPGSGCPSESKIGEVEIESPLVQEKIEGSLYIARQRENPFGSLLALYLVARNPEIGLLVKQACKVEPDPVSGQLTTTCDNLPQLPFSRFRLSFRSGQRAPLITPPACGAYALSADLYPWSRPEVPLHEESSFQITAGPEGQPCPTGGTPPFHPELLAGSVNPTAGHYSPFYVRIDRHDSEQEITHFSIKLPPGVIGKLAGVPFCSDAAIAQAKAREHEGGGTEEEAAPSCPAASQVGRTLVGTGVGDVLAYAPGKVYLAGPYHGSAISVVAITDAVVGPFDLGTVVVREALRVNPETAEVFVDAAGSDPIPHIVDGIPTHLRDIRIYMDKPEFVLNPTSCEPTSTASTVLGSGLSFTSEADDQPITVTSPFQAADCAALGFKPALKLSLKGSTKRGGTPAFKAVLNARPGDANIGSAQVTLPRSEFLDNAHIGTVCTRVQFAEGNLPGEKCPANSVYGFARALTPILSEPLEGPVYLRSTGTGAGHHLLPDLLAALHSGEINIALDGHVEGVHGGIRNTFEAVPDAPVTQFTLEMAGGSKGLLENSTNLCGAPHRANAVFTGHNGKVEDFNPLLAVKCPKHRGKGKRAKRHHRHGGRS
jgi:hypothetical protein